MDLIQIDNCYEEKMTLLHFRTPSPPPPPPIVIDDSHEKNAAESFNLALTLTLGWYESAIAPKKLAQNIDGGASFTYGVFSILQMQGGTGSFGRFFCLKFYILWCF